MKAFRDQWHVDVLLKPGNNGDAIPAHKVVLAARSKVFRNLLVESEECRSAENETITLAKLNREELETFLEFLYMGTLPDGKLKQHAKSLYLAADKYDIAYLQDLCRKHLIAFLSPLNALDVLELSDVLSDKILKDTALNFIFKHMEEIASLDVYERFVRWNPNLAVQITRQFLSKFKPKKKDDFSACGEQKPSFLHADFGPRWGSPSFSFGNGR